MLFYYYYQTYSEMNKDAEVPAEGEEYILLPGLKFPTNKKKIIEHLDGLQGMEYQAAGPFLNALPEEGAYNNLPSLEHGLLIAINKLEIVDNAGRISHPGLATVRIFVDEDKNQKVEKGKAKLDKEGKTTLNTQEKGVTV
jgi:hypothetical protein